VLVHHQRVEEKKQRDTVFYCGLPKEHAIEVLRRWKNQ
jgi:hypothetical protein